MSVSAMWPPLETIPGRICAGTEEPASSSVSHRPVRMFMSIVREALLTSVTWRRPRVSFEMSHESIVPPAIRRPARAPRAGDVVEQPAKLRARKVRIEQEARLPPDHPFVAGLLAADRMSGAVRRSCQTIARWRGRPVSRSQSTTVSR